ncbi:hypothetical protein BDSB_01265 [Burkholderia dolosa PC543]|nr:hypothetical protein BDSB_01265 [Burkholderia dolosa PC543]
MWIQTINLSQTFQKKAACVRPFLQNNLTQCARI